MASGGRRGVWLGLAGASTIVNALAIFNLAQHALLVRNLSAPVEMVLSAYDATTQVLLGWAERSLQETLTWAGSLVEWRPTLYSHWRDMLAIVAIWTSALVWARWRAFTQRWSASVHDGMLGFPHIFAFALAVLVIAIGGLLMVTIFGVLPIRSSDIGVQVAIAVCPWLVFAAVMLLGRVMRGNEVLGMLVLAGIAAFATWWLSQASAAASASASWALGRASSWWVPRISCSDCSWCLPTARPWSNPLQFMAFISSAASSARACSTQSTRG